MSTTKIQLNDDPAAMAIYRELAKDRVFGADLDIGYYDMSIVERYGKSKIVGKGDGVLEPQEVYRYVLDNYGEYKNLLARETGLFYPFALPKAARRTKEQKAFYGQIKSLVALIEGELGRNGIERGDEKFARTMFDSLFYAIKRDDSEGRKEVGGALEKVGMRAALPKMEGIGSKLADGTKRCTELLPLLEHLNRGCECDKMSSFNSFYFALSVAGLRPATALVKARGEEGASLQIGIPNAEGEMEYPWAEDVEWTVASKRIILGNLYAGAAMEAFGRDIDKAERWIEGASILMPEFSMIESMAGVYELRRKSADPKAAYEHFSRALEMMPGNPIYEFWASKSLYRMDRYDEAIPGFERALEGKIPEDIERMAVSDLGMSYLRAGRERDALEHFKKAVKAYPEEGRCHLGLVYAHDAFGNLEGATKVLMEVSRRFPENLYMAEELFFHYVGLYRMEDARSELNRVEEIDEDSLYVHEMRGLMLLYDERAEEALTSIERAIDMGKVDGRSRSIEGECHIHLGNFAEAKSVLEESLSIAPDNDRSRVLLCIALVQLNEYGKAADVIGRLNPDSIDESLQEQYHFTYGIALAMSGKYVEAEEHMNASLESQPEDPLAHNIMYYVYRNTGRPSDARGALGRLKRLAAKDPSAGFYVGRIYFDDEDYRNAAKWYGRTLKAYPDNEYVKWQLAAARLYMKNFRAADRLSADLIESGKNNLVKAYAYAIQSQVFMSRGDKEGAYKNCEEAVSLDIPYHYPYALLSGRYLEAGQYDRAEQLLNRALELEKDDAGVHANFGILSFDRGEFGKAVGYFDKAIEIRPDALELFHARGASRFRDFDYAGALSDYERLGRRTWRDAKLAWQHGWVLHSNGRSDEAKRYLKRSLKLDRGNEVVKFMLFQTNVFSDVKEARSILDELRGSASDKAMLALAQGVMELIDGDLASAKGHTLDVLRQDPLSVDAYNMLGVIHAELGDRTAAAKAFRKAMKLAPKYQPPHENLRRLTEGEEMTVPQNKYDEVDLGSSGPGVLSRWMLEMPLQPYMEMEFRRGMSDFQIFTFGPGGIDPFPSLNPSSDPSPGMLNKFRLKTFEYPPELVPPYLSPSFR